MLARFAPLVVVVAGLQHANQTQDSAECAITCTGTQSMCCVQEDHYPPVVTATRCIDPSIDVCVTRGRVCPVEAPEICFQYTYQWPKGFSTCYNPATHVCLQRNFPHEMENNLLCAVGSVTCGNACVDPYTVAQGGLCCGNGYENRWYSTYENKQCCSGSCSHSGCAQWLCSASDETCPTATEDGSTNSVCLPMSSV